MPEIKNTFLAGKMNKSLDDRLLPEGEYRDALNIQVTKSEGADVGVIQNIKGNQKISGDVTLDESAKVIGSCFDDQNNVIYYFIHQNVGVSSKIIKYDKKVNPPVASEIVSSNILAFNRNSFVQANVVENYLFFTDGVNEPRKIDTTINYDSGSIQEYNLTVAKPAPQFAPNVSIQTTDAGAGNYIEEKFVRFAYRYKFSDNTHSVYSPFSNIVFGLDTDVLTEDQIKDAYSKGELDFLTNKAKTISVQAKSPGGAIGFFPTSYGIVQVDILMKSSDSPAVMLLDSVQIDEFGAVPAFIYNSEKPKITLPENQLTRVFDNVPRKAVVQEVVGNRIVYGNFTQGFDVNTTTKLPFTVRTDTKNPAFNSLGVKINRTYEVGIVFSDDYGRTSPVMFGQNKSVTFDRFAPYYYYDRQIFLEFDDNLQGIIDQGFKYYSVVVKQAEQEYYNVYVPGISFFNGKSYFSVFGDNINKIPIDASTYSTETNVSTTSKRVYLSVANNSIFLRSQITSSDSVTETVKEYEVEATAANVEMSNYVSTHAYNNTTESWSPDGTTATFQISALVDDTVLGDISANHTFVRIYVNGEKYTTAPPHQFTYDASTLTITFTENNIPQTGDSIVVFAEYDGVSMPQGQSRSIYSFKKPRPTTANLRVDEIGEIEVGIIDSSYSNGDYKNEGSLKSFSYGNLQELKITGISTLNNFDNIDQKAFDVSSDLFGIYKKDKKYLVAETEGEYGVELFNETTGKFADLAVLETKAFESVIDIYYETATQGLISEFDNASVTPVGVRVNYFNCINLKTPERDSQPSIVWQESRIRGGFNEISMDYGVQAYLTNEDYGLIHRKSSLIYSGILNNNTKVNNTNQFPSGEDITRTLDPVYGSIQKLYADTDDLLIFQEEKVSQALIDKDIIYTAEGQGLTTSGQRVISQINAYATNYGIGKDPQSFTVYAGRKYFVDRPKGAVLRLSRDGITEISNYGMRSYFRDVLNNPTISLISGSWDIYNKEYILSIHSDSNLTLGFDESNNGWVSRYSYIAEDGGSLDGRFYTFKRGHLYEHNANDLHNVFYDQPVAPSTIELIFNEGASVNKNFHNISYEGTNTWDITSINTDTLDQALPIKSNDEGYVDTDDTINLSIFKKYDEKYFANIINDSQAKPDEVVFGNSVSGVKGHFMKVVLSNDKESYQELFSISTNYNVNSY
jgi:hypothetical protein